MPFWSSKKSKSDAKPAEEGDEQEVKTVEQIEAEIHEGKAPSAVLNDKTEAEVTQFIGLMLTEIKRDKDIASFLGVKAHMKDKAHYDLQRFLRARNYNVDKAMAMYKECMTWREVNGIDKLIVDGKAVADPHEEVYQRICPHHHHGFDKQGRPLYIEHTGRVHMPTLLTYQTEDEVVNRHIRYMEIVVERTRESSKKLGRQVEAQTIVMDLTNLSIKPDMAAMRVFRRTMKVDQDYYPERLGQYFMINSPRLFGVTWEIIKNFIDPNTVRKLDILGTNYEDKLLACIDAENLPKEWGGSCDKCGPEGCLKAIRAMPKDYPKVLDSRATIAPDETFWNKKPLVDEDDLHAAGYFDDDSDDMD